MSEATTFHWLVFFRNDKMGFQKHYEVTAPNVVVAMADATASLEEAGYKTADMQIVSVQRIREVGT